MESVTAHFGNLLKVDNLNSSLTRSRFALVCLEIDLSKPLCWGFWLGDDSQCIFVVVLCEKLPTFCYTRGLIGHFSNSYPHSSVPRHDGSPPSPHVQRWLAVESNQGLGISRPEDVPMSVDPGTIPNDPLLISLESPPDQEFGSWLLVPHWGGRACGHGVALVLLTYQLTRQPR